MSPRPLGRARAPQRQPSRVKRCQCLFRPEIVFAPDLSGIWIEHERECPLWPRTGLGNMPVGPRSRQKTPPPTPDRVAAPARRSVATPKAAKPAPKRRTPRNQRHLRAEPSSAPPIESVLRAVEQITDRAPRRRGKDRWMALCPAHDDRNPSLSIRKARGKVLVHCFAGCSTEAVLDALRLSWGDLFEAER
jgi:CHC2 zinc finger